ncbi:MAG TPA: hypothetical protein VG819_02375 [Rhizomicrobium sp.]|nr:hypothetical protein [Rhizomicrobium sp.]
MTMDVWLPLSSDERNLLRQALATLVRANNVKGSLVNALAKKIISAQPHPDITIGVYGGQVQWTAGNPFPIRIVDYDGERDDLPDTDENGEPCRMWFEPSDEERETSLRKVAS